MYAMRHSADNISTHIISPKDGLVNVYVVFTDQPTKDILPHVVRSAHGVIVGAPASFRSFCPLFAREHPLLLPIGHSPLGWWDMLCRVCSTCH